MKQSLVSKLPILESADPEMIKVIVEKLTKVTFQPGETIIEKGDLGTDMFFIDNGTASVHFQSDAPAAFELDSGSFFGEIALMESSPRSATIKASSNCSLYALTKVEFTEVLKDFPDFESTFRKSADARIQRRKSTTE